MAAEKKTSPNVESRLLWRERIDREHRVRVAVADDGKVGGEYKAFQPPPVDDDAAGGIHLLGHFQDVVAQAALYVGGSFLFSVPEDILEYVRTH